MTCFSCGNECTDNYCCVSNPVCLVFCFIFGFIILILGIVLVASVPAHVCPGGFYKDTCYIYIEKVDSFGNLYNRTDHLSCTSETDPSRCRNREWPSTGAKNQNTSGLFLIFGCMGSFVYALILICLRNGYEERKEIRLSLNPIIDEELGELGEFESLEAPVTEECEGDENATSKKFQQFPFGSD